MISAIISALAATGIAALTFYWTKRREREADWRKLKLEQYRQYINALSGIIGSQSSTEAQRRYSDAVNGLALVASPKVLRELYRFLDETLYRNPSRSSERHDEILTALLNAMRTDVDPSGRESTYAAYRMIDVPPRKTVAESEVDHHLPQRVDAERTIMKVPSR